MVEYEINGNNKLAIIPVRLESSERKINETVSLIYAIDTNGRLNFMGARPHLAQDEEGLFPKEILNINPEDKIYTIGQSFEFINSFTYNNSKIIENEPIEATENFEPKYITYDGNYNIRIVVCDYAKKCSPSKWYNFD